MQPVRLVGLSSAAALAILTSAAGAQSSSHADVAAVMAPINAVFAGVAARDAAAISEQLVVGGSNTEVTEQSDGSRKVQRLGWPEALAGLHPGPEKFEERLINRSIESDGSVAMVWGDYVFLVNGKVSHCGLDLFDLVREGGAWKIANSTSSQRTKGCPAQ
jgi:hypothetical protein